jgi:4-hydroxy-tetrahydrodipicolinate reductase
LLFELAKTMASQLKDAGYQFSIAETHHKSKLDAPSGTALTLRDSALASLGIEHPSAKDIPIEAHRTGEVAGIHSLIATGPCDHLILTHESTSRRPFAEGAVRAAEWLSTHTGVYDFREVVGQL